VDDEHRQSGDRERLRAVPDEDVRPGRSVFADDDEFFEDDIELPHWTEPATGSSPSVASSDTGAWSSLTGSVPRWREQAADFDDDPAFSFLEDPVVPGEPAEEPHDFFTYDTGGDESNFDDLDDLDDLDGDDLDDLGGHDALIVPAGAAAAAAGTAAAASASRARPGPGAPTGRPKAAGPDEMVTRLITGVALVAVALVAFKIGPKTTVALVAAVLALAAAEFFAAIRKAGYQPVSLLGIVACGAMPLAIYWRGLEAVPLVLALTVVFSLLWFLLGVGDESPLLNAGVTVFGVSYIGLLGGFAALLLTLPHGIGMITAAVIGTIGYDVGGFLIGRVAGKSPLSAASPNKTVEGLAGGMGAAVVATTLIVGFGKLTPFGDTPGSISKTFLLGIAIAVAAPLGDLCESLIKRDIGVKDMGTILPGHGGLLDRFDALLFVLPVTYFAARALLY
jgi:phosphatidate cytidylyltransferase